MCTNCDFCSSDSNSQDDILYDFPNGIDIGRETYFHLHETCEEILEDISDETVSDIKT